MVSAHAGEKQQNTASQNGARCKAGRIIQAMVGTIIDDV
jgi:hypothetical protein